MTLLALQIVLALYQLKRRTDRAVAAVALLGVLLAVLSG
jgi:hypothetical protein